VDGPRFYWLCHSEGFRVDTPEGRLGLVEAVMFRVRPTNPDALIVRAGVLGRRLVIVPIEIVADVLPRKERILLARVPDLGGADFLSELRARLRRLAAEGAGAGLRPLPQPEPN
jgi:CelD/BcsL family acetyltransferase involved in cellulose biosynthesis